MKLVQSDLFCYQKEKPVPMHFADWKLCIEKIHLELSISKELAHEMNTQNIFVNKWTFRNFNMGFEQIALWYNFIVQRMLVSAESLRKLICKLTEETASTMWILLQATW